MKRYYTPERISEALFHTDPMNTCCKENDCFGEYDNIANGVFTQLLMGCDLKEALILEMVEWFFEADNAEVICVDPVRKYLEDS